jgi:adenine-specific DNA-methyltransferase
MPELFFKGKEYVYNHHLTVPYRPLLPDAKKSIGPADLGGNLIIHGDNLHALKSLLPRYAGKVDLVFIDPPYNTGNENWSYNDNVNSPIMQEWLRSNPVNAEDMLRHDKWLCMMWPRLTLLRELLSERGSLWMTLDDNELHRARSVLDELFGEENFIATIAWVNKVSPANDATYFSDDFDHIIIYAKNAVDWRPNRLVRTEKQEAIYGNPDNDPRGPWNSMTYSTNKSKSDRPNLYYPITNPNTGAEIFPTDGTTWRFSKERHDKNVKDDLLFWGMEGKAKLPRYKRFLSEVGGVVPRSVWSYEECGSTQSANIELQELGLSFPTPKPLPLLERIIEIASGPTSLILDSFSGGGTTAHATLRVNQKDQGSRRYVLVECEDYADELTAERVRRAIKGYAWAGTQREELLREKVTWTQLQKAETLIARVDAIKIKEGFAEEAAQMSLTDVAASRPALRKPVKGEKARRFDKIAVSVKDGELLVEGEKKISKRVEGLGGEFTYCTLGEPLDPEGILSGKTLPDYESLGAWLYYAATGGTLVRGKTRAKEYYLGEALDKHLWLIYKPDLTFLKSADAALTLSFARTLREKKPDKPHLVFAAAKFLSNRQLLEHGVEYAALPHALYRGA